MKLHKISTAIVPLSLIVLTAVSHAVEIAQITEKNYDNWVPAGKEVDAIIGDWVIRNNKIVAIIAQPTVGRKANMTVRGVGGTLIDLTRRSFESDQLSCFYPAGNRYLFEQADSLEIIRSDGAKLDLGKPSYRNKKLSLSVSGTTISGNGTVATITYSLADDDDALSYKVAVTNESAQPQQLTIEAALRCDGNLFTAGVLKSSGVFYAEDRYFGQSYGITFAGGNIIRTGDRNMILRPSADAELSLAAGESKSWDGMIACSQGLPGIDSWASGLSTSEILQPMQLKLQSSDGVAAHAPVEFFRNGQTIGIVQSDTKGMVRTELLPGEYSASITPIGREHRIHEFDVSTRQVSDTITLTRASRVQAKITDSEGKPIAAKVQFVGANGTPDPNFGPDSAISAIKNVVYCAKGKFSQPINAGEYKAIVSHGPEFDAKILELTISQGGTHSLECELLHSVDTRGWVSTEYHSHSSPSGDNVSHQTGRVLNLLAEHIEFAPCTEHNRIDTYADDLLLLGATDALATCTGMELTGSPLPINHQNAFPMHRHPHTQDGGGPQTDANPVKQIERLALWDNASSKVVQTNHPNIPQILGDRDLNGEPDEGFRGMLGWMDVIEIHPPQAIFDVPDANLSTKEMFDNRMFFWMQLLNLGYRIPGVVNTDAHYNFHGSGWLRNYVRSDAQSPSAIAVEDIVHATEHGQMVMTTGPFLETGVVLTGKTGNLYGVGEDVILGDNSAAIYIRVQCANWLDINRVQVFANGRPLKKLNFTRKSHPEYFTRDVMRFERLIDLPKFDEDTHIIVAAIGEGLELGPVMGPENGKLPPVAVTNPIFLDVDGSGFQGNGDDLGVPFMLPEVKD